mgnify:CR=1 FL=1
MLLRPTIRDDDGKPVPLVRFNASYLPFSMGPLPDETQAAMRRSMKSEPMSAASVRSWGVNLLVGVMPAVLINVPVFVMIFLRSSSLWTIAFSAAMLPVAVALMFWVGPLGWTDQQRRAAAGAALKAGYCASCGYPLRADLPADHLIRCPECTAAWRVQHW